MGINIIPYYLGNKLQYEDRVQNYTYYETTEHPTFDGLRFSGDKEFIGTEDITWMSVFDDPNERDTYQYSRPTDIDKAIQWVLENLYKENQQRLIELLEEMRVNENLWIYVSY